ncbi:C45 family peptidase [Anderseniella sp. Alg231-50]|uniref:C45 family peptidase n=1 Tax=Anderseniella sp. Alg231-50 TaxID=1922226 RepID=UPI00307B7293
MSEELIIDLSRQPQERWAFSDTQLDHARQLIDVYRKDLGQSASLAETVAQAVRPILPADYWGEMQSVASRVGVPADLLLLCNAYYDVFSALIGCTAFAVDTPEGPLHARNLDWWTENRLLNETSMACRFTGAPAGEFISIGWPGYLGVLSGMAPGRFAITLNAVSSEEAAQIALPVSFLIRKTFEEAGSFGDAVERLAQAVIPGNCLLLVSGVGPGEMLVIERTPTRSAIRQAEAGRVIVANEYLKLDAKTAPADTELQSSSCSRYDRMAILLQRPPKDLQGCIGYLRNPAVQMDITVQQMAFHTAGGGSYWQAA